MLHRIEIAGIPVDVEFKDIKNIHLSVLPPEGDVRVAAPSRMNLDGIRVFLITRLSWIRQQRKKFEEQEREPIREYIERESHYLWGKRYLLSVEENEQPTQVRALHSQIKLNISADADRNKRDAVVAAWYRDELRRVAEPLIETWEERLGVKVERLFVQRMRTMWGSCNPDARSIRLNTELAKKPQECLEYVVVHEMLHMLEPTHSERFQSLLDVHLPQWRGVKELLNRLPFGEVNDAS
jgi:predicted metal-dependent hydrolase